MTEQEMIRQTMSVLGKRTSAKKARSSAANAALARARRSTQRTLKPCTCGQSLHRADCPVYKREKQQKRRAKKV